MGMTDLWTILNHSSLSWVRVAFSPSPRGAYGFGGEVLPSQGSRFPVSTTTLSCRLWPIGTNVLGELLFFHRCMQKKLNADTALDMRTKISGKKGITRPVSRGPSYQHLENFASYMCASKYVWAQLINLQCASYSQCSNIWMITGPLVSWWSSWNSGRCMPIWNGYIFRLNEFQRWKRLAAVKMCSGCFLIHNRQSSLCWRSSFGRVNRWNYLRCQITKTMCPMLKSFKSFPPREISRK